MKKNIFESIDSQLDGEYNLLRIENDKRPNTQNCYEVATVFFDSKKLLQRMIVHSSKGTVNNLDIINGSDFDFKHAWEDSYVSVVSPYQKTFVLIKKKRLKDCKFKIVVASNSNFFDKIFDIHVDSWINKLKTIQKHQICFVVNNSNRASDMEMREGINIHYTTSDAWEYSALYKMITMPIYYDYLLLLHDTSVPGRFFEDLLLNIDVSMKCDFIPMVGSSFLNIALFSQKYLFENREELQILFSGKITKEVGIDFEINGLLKSMSKNNFYLNSAQQNEHPVLISESFNIFNLEEKNTTRRLTYIPAIDLYKSQNNLITNPINGIIEKTL